MVDSDKTKLLSSGNPQIAKGDGDAPVMAYLEAMPGWKSELGHRLDKLVARTYPDVRKAVRWNTPLYGKEDGWFFSMYCYKTYVQLTFMRGADLIPPPPGASKVDGVRYFNIHQSDELDDALISEWISQSVKLPGVKLWQRIRAVPQAAVDLIQQDDPAIAYAMGNAVVRFGRKASVAFSEGASAFRPY